MSQYKFSNAQVQYESEIMELSGLAVSAVSNTVKSLTGRVVSRSKSRPREESIGESIAQSANENPGQIRIERNEFIQRKLAKMEKDKKYGFTLAEMGGKIRKK